jgi:hypothetical protein
MDEGLKDMKLTEQEEERRMEEEEERRMEEEEEEMRMEGEEDEIRMEGDEVEMEKGDKIRGENLCPAFSSNDSKAVDLFFNVVPGIEVQLLFILWSPYSREMEYISRGPTFGDFVTVARLQSTRIPDFPVPLF